jgi:4-amino-4-deoxy-L-arabinose transferase-like glycosyltransferase
VAQTQQINCISRLPAQAGSRSERLVIAGLCLAGAVRVFVFCAAFPFFNNVDEWAHFDLVFKYSQGHLPIAGLEKLDPRAIEIIATCATGEFAGRDFNRYPDRVAGLTAYFTKRYNYETWAWPVYYILAGFWCWAGKIFHLTDVRLLYWIRFLNVPLMAAFVWVSYVFSRRFLRSNPQQRIALSLMVAFFPQDVFFAITADVLSPVVFAAAFVMLLGLCNEAKTLRYHLLTGLAVALTFLTKVSNIAILFLAGVIFLNEIKQAVCQKRLKREIGSLLAFALASTVPVALWLGRNYVLFGDFSGAAASIQDRTWTLKPFGEMFNHPILTPSGLFYFLTELTRTFWRGEFIWNFKKIASGFMDWFYIISSAVFLTASIAGFILNKTQTDKSNSLALKAGLFIVVLSIAFLAVMSMRYDFGQCVYPSREKPYFISGRLISGAILPFLLLYIDGLHRILSKLRLANCLLIAVSIIIAAITISEIILSRPVFVSPYNWFHI